MGYPFVQGGSSHGRGTTALRRRLSFHTCDVSSERPRSQRAARFVMPYDPNREHLSCRPPG